ncbi:hypothetical protein NP233_g4277 [Leucocoprinus birnbaumii]|uniref:Uncharacterized protein n=1 Tax=Leucocoprinus birnbaumii TaxID=56174 RepID=A0AAD5W1L4_9AGAR|nr:hypothetical protein NP233_g4277 [Leucocoprinus birnbaumii]
MSRRPKSFDNLASGVHTSSLDEQNLTPRTPRSRFDRQDTTEGQYDDVDLHPAVDNETQTLLSSELNRNSPTYPTQQSSGRTKNASKAQRFRSATRFVDIPLILGTLLACFLFGLIVFSYKHPGRLQEYVGINGPKPSPVADEAVKNPTPPPLKPPVKEMLLHPSEYVAQCRERMGGFMSHGDYWDEPLMDMKMDTINATANEDSAGIEMDNTSGKKAVCSKTITYLLDGEVGLLADLSLIAQTAALARERNRTLFIDDTYWNRGKWTDHFESHKEGSPEPGCLAPHPKDVVACPRTASHWVITAHTAKYHFGHAFSEHYENPYAHSLNRLRPIFDAARESFVSTIRPNSELSSLIQSARHELKTLFPSATANSGGTYLSVHIRRGDRKQRFSHTPYTSIEEYTSYIESTRARLSSSLGYAPVYLASDSPAAEREFAEAYAGPYLSLRRSESAVLQRLASSQDYDQKVFNNLSLEERSGLTKGMIVDFALLSGAWSSEGEPAPRAGICTIRYTPFEIHQPPLIIILFSSSNVCKMLAVGLGWDNAFGSVDELGSLDKDHEGWVELEEKGTVVPIWKAFELF